MAIILIVEDEVFIRQYAEWTIQDLGHDVLLAGDLDEALGHLTAPGHIDTLFVDIRLHTHAHGGFEIANHAVRCRPSLAVIYTSGNPLTGQMADLFVVGGLFVRKPYTPAQLAFHFGSIVSSSTAPL